MKIKTSELEGAALDWAVAKVLREDMKIVQLTIVGHQGCAVLVNEWRWSPSTDWAQGGPLIESLIGKLEDIEMWKREDDWFVSQSSFGSLEWAEKGPTLLIAAMRAIVSAELGDEVDVPEELRP